MKYLILSILISWTTAAQAVTQGRFFGMHMMINISSKFYDGSFDDTAYTLFKAMNVPIQDSMIGPGKSLKAAEKTLNFICAQRGEENFQCTLFIFPTAWGQIAQGKASFVVTGSEARAFSEQFHLPNGEFSLMNPEGTLRIDVQNELFSIKFNESGL